MIVDKMRKQILSSLKGSFEVVDIDTKEYKDSMAIVCNFLNKGRCGVFRYFWNTQQQGIDHVRDYEEDEGEDIYENIHEWVNKHFEFKYDISFKHDGKELIK